MISKQTLVFLKTQIDSFEYGKDSKGISWKGKKALKMALKESYKQSRSFTNKYISDEVSKLYSKLEEDNVNDLAHFSFMKDTELFYCILKLLNITFEEVMEGGFNDKAPQKSFEILHDDNKKISSKLSDMIELFILLNGNQKRTKIEEKCKDFYYIFNNVSFFNEFNKNTKNISKANKQIAEIQQKIFLLNSIVNLNNQLITYNSFQNLMNQKIPIEYLQVKYLKVLQDSKKTELTKAFKFLEGDDNDKYYDNLIKKIDKEIESLLSATPNGFEFTIDNYHNYLKYSCLVYSLDTINRLSRVFIKSLFNNFKYRSAVEIKKIDERDYYTIIPPFFQNCMTWSDFLYKNDVQRNSIKFNYDKVKNNVDKFHFVFLKKTNTLIHQLSIYITNNKPRNFSEEYVNKMISYLDEYFIILKSFFLTNFTLTQQIETHIEDFIDKFENHTQIINNGMAGITSYENN